MNIQTIAEHSVDLDLIPEKANILDIGARGVAFSKYFQSLGHNVLTVDADDIEGITHPRLAISDRAGMARLYKSRDPQATRINEDFGLWDEFESVECVTLLEFSLANDILMWDLIKIDVEGSELAIITSLHEPPAKQLSIEFHLHTKVYGGAEVVMMENKLLSLGYFPAKHDMTEQHGMGRNYWDSLWILK